MISLKQKFHIQGKRFKKQKIMHSLTSSYRSRKKRRFKTQFNFFNYKWGLNFIVNK